MNDVPAPPERPGPADPTAGRAILRASAGGTVVFTLLAVLALFVDGVVPAFVVVSLLLFAGGTLAFVVAFLRAVDRSRTESIGVGGLFFGAGAAPARVQALLLGSLGLEVVVAITAAALRPYTAVAFGTLAPMWGLGLAGLWVARHGWFPPRPPELTRAGRRDAERAAHRRVTGSRPATPDRPGPSTEPPVERGSDDAGQAPGGGE
ncbi:hypothetical protein [Rhabdothermincola salaria]|uniref:hypothetical protein n=1 Tax=Rhabdothermincola salaria TaxID=2903142 RepID=UPI001E6411A6|nr:hypothetical protein [Rhabdothermincola salaria]MCD9622439.1 hypothetical protein [Rhabdothermincola salaria]